MSECENFTKIIDKFVIDNFYSNKKRLFLSELLSKELVMMNYL